MPVETRHAARQEAKSIVEKVFEAVVGAVRLTNEMNSNAGKQLMRRSLRSRSISILLCGWIVFCVVGEASAADWRFEVRFDQSVHQEPFTGRVYLAFTKSRTEPRLAPSNWFRLEQFVALDIVNWQPGEPLAFDTREDERLLAYPVPLSEMKLAGYRAQAIARFNPHSRNVGSGVGNGYSPIVVVEETAAGGQPTQFLIDRLVRTREFKETGWTKLLQMRSRLLSKFHNRDVTMQAAVTLPKSYHDEPDRRYPTIFIIPGFGGTHYRGVRNEPVTEGNDEGVEFIRVLLDPSSPLGHHVFADSANNGPVGQALIDRGGVVNIFFKVFNVPRDLFAVAESVELTRYALVEYAPTKQTAKRDGGDVGHYADACPSSAFSRSKSFLTERITTKNFCDFAASAARSSSSSASPANTPRSGPIPFLI